MSKLTGAAVSSCLIPETACDLLPSQPVKMMPVADGDLEEGEFLPSPATKRRLKIPSPPPELEDRFTTVTHKKKKKSKQASSSEYYDVYGGKQASASAEIKSQMVRLQDVQNLILWVLGESINPQWVFLKNKPLISRVVFIVVHGLDQHLYKKKQALLTHLTADLGNPAVVVAQNAAVHPVTTMTTLMTVPLTKKRRREESQERSGDEQGSTANGCVSGGGGGAKRRQAGAPPFPPSFYKMTVGQLQERNYPLPSVDEGGVMRCPEGFVPTEPSEVAQEQDERMVALDCEMCVTSQGLELTRATLVDEQGQVLLDELVMPVNPILDYNTRFSGITPDMLANVTTRLEDVQRKVLQVISSGTLLVGHSLENDLVALRMVHANIIDTSILFPHPRGPPHRPALRILADRFLRRQIQRGSHDSIDDARATMELALLKIKHGPDYGVPQTERVGQKLTEVLSEHNRRTALVDRQQNLQRFTAGNCSAIAVATDDEAAEKVSRECCNNANHLVVTQLMRLWSLCDKRAISRRTSQEEEAARACAAATAAADAVSSAPACSTDGQVENDTTVPSKASPASGPVEANTAVPSEVSPAFGSVETNTTVPTEVSPASGQVETNTAVPTEVSPASGQVDTNTTVPTEVSPACGPVDTNTTVPTEVSPTAVEPNWEQELDIVLLDIDRQCHRVFESLPANSLMIVATGEGDTAEVRRLQDLRHKCHKSSDNTRAWTLQDENRLSMQADRAIRGLCFCGVKQHV